MQAPRSIGDEDVDGEHGGNKDDVDMNDIDGADERGGGGGEGGGARESGKADRADRVQRKKLRNKRLEERKAKRDTIKKEQEAKRDAAMKRRLEENVVRQRWYQLNPSLDSAARRDARLKKVFEEQGCVYICQITPTTLQEKDLIELPSNIRELSDIRKWISSMLPAATAGNTALLDQKDDRKDDQKDSNDNKQPQPSIIRFLKGYKFTDKNGRGRNDFLFQVGTRVTYAEELVPTLGKAGLHCCFRPLDLPGKTRHIPENERRLFIVAIPITLDMVHDRISACGREMHVIREVTNQDEKNKLLSGTAIYNHSIKTWVDGRLVMEKTLEFDLNTGQPICVKRRIVEPGGSIVTRSSDVVT